MAALPQFVKRTELQVSEVPALDKIRSSMAKGIAYNAETETLTVHMVKGNNVYQYAPVCEDIYDALYEDESIGRALNRLVVDKPGIKCVQIAANYTA